MPTEKKPNGPVERAAATVLADDQLTFWRQILPSILQFYRDYSLSDDEQISLEAARTEIFPEMESVLKRFRAEIAIEEARDAVLST